MYVSVKGGTNAGWRRVNADKREDWRCSSCRLVNRRYLVACSNCKHPREA